MLVVANLVDLSAIASVGSACSLLIFLLVGIAGYRRRAETGSRAPIVLTAIAVTAIVLAFFAVDTLQQRAGNVRRDRRDRAAVDRPRLPLEAQRRAPRSGVTRTG